MAGQEPNVKFVLADVERGDRLGNECANTINARISNKGSLNLAAIHRCTSSQTFLKQMDGCMES